MCLLLASRTYLHSHGEPVERDLRRLVIRPSGTKPVIRVMGEGDDKTLVEDVVEGIVEALTDVAA